MKKVLTTVFAGILVSFFILMSVPLRADAALTAAPAVNETYVKNRICDLAKKLGVNNGTLDVGEGTYFTVNQNPCSNEIMGHYCENCYNSSVVNAKWFKNIFGTVSPAGFPRQYGEDGRQAGNLGWSCWGFATFAMWYVTSTDNTNSIDGILAAHTTFNKANIQRMLEPGDIIRCNGHSMLFISAGENSIKVMDCNGAYSGGSCRVRIREVPYTSYSGLLMGVTRASNYSENIQLWDVADGDIVRGVRKVWAKRNDNDTNHYAQFYLDGVPITDYLSADNDGFFACKIDSSWYEEGRHEIKIVYANTSSSWSDSVVVTFEKKVQLWGIDEGEKIGSSQAVYAKRFDNDSNHYAEFSLDDKPISDYIQADANNLFSVYINPNDYTEGKHQLKVRYANTNNEWTSERTIYIEHSKKVTIIALNKTTMKLTAGEAGQLTATVFPSDASNKKVNWTSSNTSVATVDSNGKVTAVGTGTATITATAADGSGVKATCTVTVEPNLAITTQPSNASVTEGTNVVFKVAATGSNLTYQWQFKNASATYWTDSTMSGATTNSITVKATTARNGYQYRCVVKDGSGNKVISNAAKLTVNKAISITGQPSNASVTEGANATFKVTATGSNLTYQWQFKNASATYWSDSTMAGATTNSITVKGTTARNGYQYRCVVKDANGNKVTSNAAKLTVVQGQSVKITGQPASQVVLEGGNATFKVTASGTGLTYQWQFKNASSDYWSNSSMTGSNTNSITVKATTARNGYQYRCVVKDGNGNKVTSNAATLTVVQNSGVKITGQPASQTVTAGSSATFKVTASGSGLTYQWQFRNATSDYWSNSGMAGSNTNSITVQGTAARNGYQYRCVVKDENGNKVTSNAAKLTVK